MRHATQEQRLNSGARVGGPGWWPGLVARVFGSRVGCLRVAAFVVLKCALSKSMLTRSKLKTRPDTVVTVGVTVRILEWVKPPGVVSRGLRMGQ